MTMRTVAEISAALAEHESGAAAKAEELRAALEKAQRAVRFECDACHRAVKVGDAIVVQNLEFRCPGQSGGYYVNARRWIKCPHCGGTTNPYLQPEIDALPNNLFASVEKRTCP